MSWGTCRTCNQPFMSYREYAQHTPCGPFAGEDIVVQTRRSYAQWGDADAVLVHVNPKTGDVRYPGRHNHKLKDGYEKRYLRNLQEVNKFEKEHQVANHVMHFDRNGRDLQDWNVGHH